MAHGCRAGLSENPTKSTRLPSRGQFAPNLSYLDHCGHSHRWRDACVSSCLFSTHRGCVSAARQNGLSRTQPTIRDGEPIVHLRLSDESRFCRGLIRGGFEERLELWRQRPEQRDGKCAGEVITGGLRPGHKSGDRAVQPVTQEEDERRGPVDRPGSNQLVSWPERLEAVIAGSGLAADRKRASRPIRT